MAKALDQISQISSAYIIYDNTQACKQWFEECFRISGGNYDDWLEQRCAEFNWWTSSLKADKKGLESLDVQLRLRPDVGDVVSSALKGLESSLSDYYDISLAVFSPRSPERKPVVSLFKGLTDAKQSPSPWFVTNDSRSKYFSSGTYDAEEGVNQKSHNDTLDYGTYHEPRLYIKTNLEILIRIHIEIQRSGLKFKYQRADDALRQAEEAYQRQKTDLGECNALEGPNGDHEKFRRNLTILVLGDRYIRGLTKIQHRLINANVVRRNRLIYAGSAPRLLLQSEEKYREQPNPKDAFHQTSAIGRAKTATAKVSAGEEHLNYPDCPANHGPFPCPYCPTILTGEYAERDKWREHVAQDLCAYVCIFEDCDSPDDMFASTYEWMSHMARFHSEVDWLCQECVKDSASSGQDVSKFSFQSSALLKQHMLNSHHARDPEELKFLIESSKRTLGIQRVRCPLCSEGLTTLENGDKDGTDGMASLSSTSQCAGLVRLEENKHIATHIHEFALQSLKEPILEDPQISTSHSTAKSKFQSKYENPEENLKTLSTDQPSTYNLDDVAHMLDDLRDDIRGLLSEQGPLKQRSLKLSKLPRIENAALSHDMSLLSELLDSLARGGKTLQPRFKSLGDEDINAFAKSLNECRVTISQFSDLTANDTMKKSLYIQLQMLHDLKHSNEILQQAFRLTLYESMGQSGDNFPLTETEDLQPEEIKKNKSGLKETTSNALIMPEEPDAEGEREETSSEVTRSGAAGYVTSEIEVEVEDNRSLIVQTEKGQNEEDEDEEDEYEEDEYEEDEDEEFGDEESEGEEAQTKRIQEDMTEFIKRASLQSFFPDDSPLVSTLANNAFKYKNSEENLLDRDVDIQGITRLSLYQPVLYCDDSTSMKAGSRVDDQKEMVRRVTRISTSIVPAGYGTSLQFINHVRDVHNDKLSQQEVEAIMNSVKPSGHTRIGHNMKNKILKPLVYDVIRNNKRLERPILVSCITDGCPSDEPTDTLKKEILKCTRFLRENGYPPSTIRFQISQIGNSSRAGAFLKMLKEDNDLKKVLYCVPQRLDDQFKTFRHNEVLIERWLLRTLLEPIMDQDINDLKL